MGKWWGKGEILMVVDTGSIARGRYLGNKAIVVAEHLDGLEYGELQNLEAASLEFCYFGVGTGVNDDIGHYVVSLEIIQWDDRPTGRCGGRGCD
jgi:hypothetical protein